MMARILGLLFIMFFCTGMPVSAATAGCPDGQASVGPQLQTAREKLRLSELTRDRVASQLEELKASGRANSQLLQDYATYLQRVQDLVDENRCLVRKLEALCTPGSDLTAGPIAKGHVLPAGPVPAAEATDEVAALDRRLQESLASFDEMLLERINAIQAESADKMRDLAQEAAQAASRARQHGDAETRSSKDRRVKEQSANGSQSQQSTQSGKSASATGQPGAGKPTAGRRGEARTTSETGGATGKGAAAARTANPDDDDIVARQLREAAEQETDPELKEKLWKEYEAYKKNTRP